MGARTLSLAPTGNSCVFYCTIVESCNTDKAQIILFLALRHKLDVHIMASVGAKITHVANGGRHFDASSLEFPRPGMHDSCHLTEGAELTGIHDADMKTNDVG